MKQYCAFQDIDDGHQFTFDGVVYEKEGDLGRNIVDGHAVAFDSGEEVEVAPEDCVEIPGVDDDDMEAAGAFIAGMRGESKNRDLAISLVEGKVNEASIELNTPDKPIDFAGQIESLRDWDYVETEGPNDTRFDWAGGSKSMWLRNNKTLEGEIPRDVRQAVSDGSIYQVFE